MEKLLLDSKRGSFLPLLFLNQCLGLVRPGKMGVFLYSTRRMTLPSVLDKAMNNPLTWQELLSTIEPL